jgi:beta-galactosidase GanA
MTGKFHKSWGEFGGFKHPNALRYEVALNAALGAKCSIGDQLHPNGEMDMATYKLIGAAYSELEAKEPWLDNVSSVADIGVLSNEAVGSSTKADNGAVRVLQEGHYLFDFIDENSDLSKYKVVVLPETKRLSRKTADKLKGFCADGGKILAVGEAPLYEDEDKMAFDLGAVWTGKQSEYSVTYFKPCKDGGLLENTGYVLYCDTFLVKPSS